VSDGKDYTATEFTITVKAAKTVIGEISPMILGAIAGGVIAVVIAVVGLLLWKKKSKSQPTSSAGPGSNSEPGEPQTGPETGK
jgi:hypothetical protein